MPGKDVVIIDSGGANIASLTYALGRLGTSAMVTSNEEIIRSASHVILPGVGAAADAMSRLSRYGLVEVLTTLEQPLLGICLGMQLLGAKSEEDDATCLGVFPDQAVRLLSSPETPVPNMGWCRITRSKDNPLLDGIADGSWFYFVHSFALPVSERTLATAQHAEEFSAIVSHGNYFATQFHPERSAATGARILQNFLEIQ